MIQLIDWIGTALLLVFVIFVVAPICIAATILAAIVVVKLAIKILLLFPWLLEGLR